MEPAELQNFEALCERALLFTTEDRNDADAQLQTFFQGPSDIPRIISVLETSSNWCGQFYCLVVLSRIIDEHGSAIPIMHRSRLRNFLLDFIFRENVVTV